MITERYRQQRLSGERGAALVEFALIFPIFMMLALGMFSGGRSYDQDLSITHSAREGARYASTLAKDPVGLSSSFWWSAVEDRVVEAAAGDIDLSKAGHFVCVALVRPDGSVWTDGLGAPYAQVVGNVTPGSIPQNCYTDGLTDTFSRVHVLVGRPAEIETIFYTHTLKLRSQATARYEAAT